MNPNTIPEWVSCGVSAENAERLAYRRELTCLAEQIKRGAPMARIKQQLTTLGNL